MLPRMLRPARAYVCAQCRLNAISRPQTRHVTAAAREAKTKQDEKFVRKRIADLGGKDKLSMLYPRWEQPPDHGVMNAAAFFEQWSPQTAVFSRGYVSRNETVVVYGTEDRLHPWQRVADRSRKSNITSQARITSLFH